MTFEIRSRTVSAKQVAYRFDADVGEARLVDLARAEGEGPCLSDDEVVEIARLGKRIELALGAPQDIEWAIGPARSARRELFLLQTRPETVWSRRTAPVLGTQGGSSMARILATMRSLARPS